MGDYRGYIGIMEKKMETVGIDLRTARNKKNSKGGILACC